MTFAPNPQPKITTIIVGAERRPVVVIDDFSRRPTDLVDHAASACRLKPVPKGENYYPGLRAPAPQDYARALVEALRPLAAQYLGLDTGHLDAARCAFSIVTMPPETLSLTQRLPHFDTVQENQFAAVHYLCAPEHGGTAFYRHRSTGYESITRTRATRFSEALRRDIQKHGAPAACYLTQSDVLFEQTSKVDARFDRVVMYQSTMLHSGMVNAAAGLSSNPREGRLTATLFARFA